MIEVAASFDFLDTIAAIPSVQKRVSLLEQGLPSDILDTNYCVILEAHPYGGFILVQSTVDSWVVHTLFKPKTPPSVVRQAMKEGFEYMFLHTTCEEITTSACDTNPAAKRLCKQAGFREAFSSPSRFNSSKKEHFYTRRIEDFVLSSEDLGEVGHRFHSLVEETTNHLEDAVHDKFVGAAVLLISNGFDYKAQRTYNKWATLSGYELLIFSDDKSIDIGYMNIKLSDDRQVVEEVVCHTP